MLTDQKQRAPHIYDGAINNGSWKDFKKGVPRGSVLGLALFNTFIYDMFYYVKIYMYNYRY